MKVAEIFQKLRNAPGMDVIRAKLDAAHEEHARALDVYEQAALDSEIGRDIDLKAASKRLKAAGERIADLQAALSCADRRAQAVAEDAVRQADNAAWGQVEVQAAARLEASRDFETAAAQMADAFQRMELATVAIYATAPVKPNTSAGLVLAAEMHLHARHCLQVNGIPWERGAYPWGAWELQQQPSLSERIRAANEYILGARHGR